MDEVTIEALGAGGDGIAEGGTLFVPRSLPGERVAVARPAGLPGAQNGVRAEPLRLIEAAPERVAPPCPQFGRCGGCALQHASDALVAGFKEDLVRRALASRGIEGVEVRPVLTSPPGSRRRLALSARRTRKGALAGFHAARSDEIVGLDGCVVAEPALVEAAGRLEDVIGLAASRKGEVRLTLTLSEAGVDCAVSEAKPLEGPARVRLPGIAVGARLARLSWNGDLAATLRDPWQQMGRARVVPPPGGFLQPTRAGEAALVEAVTEAVGDAGRIADLFCGCGTFALPLAESAEVHAADAEAPAIAALDAAWRRTEGLKRIAAERRDLFHRPLREPELARFDAVVLDPPRAGARAQVETLAGSAVPRIAYVSCNPGTFARDARILIDGGYRLDWVQPVDQFRWSPHVELAAAFARP